MILVVRQLQQAPVPVVRVRVDLRAWALNIPVVGTTTAVHQLYSSIQ